MQKEQHLDLLGRHYQANPTLVSVEYRHWSKSKKKECYDNSWNYVQSHYSAFYVLGIFFLHEFPIEHAWIKEGTNYYDITVENRPEVEYYSFVELDIKNLLAITLSCEYAPDLLAYERFIRKNSKLTTSGA